MDQTLRSGNPGYVVGEPIMAGNLTSVTVEGNTVYPSLSCFELLSKTLCFIIFRTLVDL